jgi:hypothetical protein
VAACEIQLIRSVYFQRPIPAGVIPAVEFCPKWDGAGADGTETGHHFLAADGIAFSLSFGIYQPLHRLNPSCGNALIPDVFIQMGDRTHRDELEGSKTSL